MKHSDQGLGCWCAGVGVAHDLELPLQLVAGLLLAVGAFAEGKLRGSALRLQLILQLHNTASTMSHHNTEAEHVLP